MFGTVFRPIHLLLLSLIISSTATTQSAIGGIPYDFPPPLNVGLTEPVGPTMDVEAAAGPKTESVDQSRYSRILFVSSTHGSDSTGIGSATAPYESMHFAVSQVDEIANLDLCALFVSSGFYPTTAPIELPRRTHVYGGFEPESWNREIHQHETVIDAGGLGETVFVAADGTQIDGVVIQNGGSNHPSPTNRGRGVFVQGISSATVTNNVFRSNGSNNGGAIFMDNGSSAVINGNLFHGNSSPFGAAIYVHFNGVVQFSNNVVRENTQEVGSCIHTSGGVRSEIHGNVISSNAGSAIACRGGVTQVIENLISDGGSYGVDFDGGSTSSIESNAILRNVAGGIVCDQRSRVVISRNIIADNGAGGVSGDFNSVTDIYSNVVVGNSGVGLRGWEGVAGNNVVVKNEYAFDGGGVLWTRGTITKNLVASNRSKERGGGVHSRFVSPVTMTSNLVARNRSDWEGGGIFCNEGLLLNNIVFRNQAPQGAGVICEMDATLVLNNLVLQNDAQGKGGGVFFKYNAEVSAANNIVYGNIANGTPSQIVRESQEFSLRNSLVQGGFEEGEAILDADPMLVGQLLAGGVASATYLPDIAQTRIVVSDPPLIPGSLNGRYLEIGSMGTAVVMNSTDEIRVWGNFVEDAVGSSDSSWRVPDFRLREDSPCIGAGLGPDLLSEVPLEDLDGDTRSGQTCDIGADEFNGSHSLPTPLPTSTPTPTLPPSPSSTPTATISPTELSLLGYDLHPTGGDNQIDARDLLKFLAGEGENQPSILGFAILWGTSI